MKTLEEIKIELPNLDQIKEIRQAAYTPAIKLYLTMIETFIMEDHEPVEVAQLVDVLTTKIYELFSEEDYYEEFFSKLILLYNDKYKTFNDNTHPEVKRRFALGLLKTLNYQNVFEDLPTILNDITMVEFQDDIFKAITSTHEVNNVIQHLFNTSGQALDSEYLVSDSIIQDWGFSEYTDTDWIRLKLMDKPFSDEVIINTIYESYFEDNDVSRLLIFNDDYSNNLEQFKKYGIDHLFDKINLNQ